MDPRPHQPEAVAQRHGLRAAVADLTEVAKRPVVASTWAARVLEALAALRTALARHAEFTQAPDGLFADVVAQAPRLVNAVRHLEAEHEDLADRLTGCEAVVRGLDGEGSVEPALASIHDLVAHFERHQDRGVELVYDAYNVDISPGD